MNRITLSLAMALSLIAVSSQAADIPFKTKQAGDWNVRMRGLMVAPMENGAINSDAGAPLGLNAEIKEDMVPELDISYFFTDKIAAELVLATTPHQVNAINAAGASTRVGDVNLLPPTLTVQYHPLPTSRISPYVGAGLNYTIFYNQDAEGSTITSTTYDSALGYALQVGTDIALEGGWSFNIDFKKLFLNTELRGTSPALSDWKSNVDIDPILIGFGFGYRF